MGILLLTGSFTLQAAPKKYPEVNQGVRSKAATEALQKEQGIALLYVKGLCCPSCAIGVRSKLSKLKFVDKKRFKKGIDMDAETQLVTVALKKDQAIDPAQVEKGIDDAGYVAIEWYTLEGATLKVHPFPNQKP
jgi:copper chaperone CopZ